MLDSFLFIPANRPDFIKKIDSLKSQYVIIDFEDSVSSEDISCLSINLNYVNNKSNVFIRFPFFDEKSFDEILLGEILNKGFRNFVLPKFEDADDLMKIKELFSKYKFESLKFILLVESAKSLMFIKDLLSLKLINVFGLALGSYDYCLDMNMNYDLNNFSWARNYLLNISKAFNIKAIDVVSMEIKNMDEFRLELENTIELGFEGKLFIHPKQIQEISNVSIYSQYEIEEAYRICKLIGGSDASDANVFVDNGKIYEKPHIKRMLNIIKWKENYGK